MSKTVALNNFVLYARTIYRDFGLARKKGGERTTGEGKAADSGSEGKLQKNIQKGRRIM